LAVRDPLRQSNQTEKPNRDRVCALGPAAEAFIKGAAAHGVAGLARDQATLASLEAVHGRAPVIAALERAVAFGRFRPPT
jgi:hypothetical protein